MRVGIDTFTISPLKLDPFQTLDFCKDHALAGAQFGGIRGLSPDLDPGRLREIRAHADALGLYTHVSVSTCNPYLVKGPLDEHVADIERQIEAAAQCGWHELHTQLGAMEERYGRPVPFPRQLAATTELIRGRAPALRAAGSRIDLETHGDATTFELARIAEDVGPDVAGICLDTANVLCYAEDPVLAARRAAPYTHITHTKDAIIYFNERGYQRQTRPAGEGALDWPAILPILAEHSPDLPLSIEDHKWLFDFPIFDPAWHAFHPDLTSAELGLVTGIAWACQKKIDAGQIIDPQQYENIPLAEQLLDRIDSGRDYLNNLLDELGLRS